MVVACTVPLYSCTQMNLWNNKWGEGDGPPHPTHPTKTFVIQQQPAVIDWSICLCVAYKWATWYSALFIWNQLRQRCCVSACGTRALFLSSSLVFCLREQERATKTKHDREGREREMPGGEGCVCAVLCLTVCFSLGVSATRACVQ